MCGRYALMSAVDLLVEVFEISHVDALAHVAPRYNLAPTQTAPVVRAARDGSGRELVGLRWGLVPHWAKDLSAGARMINARSETARDKPAFRDAWRSRRCIVPADGFFEWKKPGAGDDGPKQPYFIHLSSGEPMAFAGLWERWRGPVSATNLEVTPDLPVAEDGTIRVETYTVLTTAPNRMVADLHDRMPVILEPGTVERWLDPEESCDDLLQPFPAEPMALHAVTRRMGRADFDGAECVAPVERAPRESQGGLFD